MTVALDLFAGTGWGVALQARGIREGGVEIMPEARASRAAAGMETIYHDVWDGLLSDDPVVFAHSLQIASPPCQSFSLAGKGAGRAALDDVLRAIDDRAYEQPARLRALGAETDDRTALVLTPLAHVHRDRPMFVTWEQVPPVLPVWEACAAVMRDMGYSVWVGIIRAEQYGVPQTRRRAVLIARADGIDAAPPTPTHSRYYEREPQRLDEGVLPWVSMGEALGIDGFSAEKVMGRGMVERHGSRPGRDATEPAFTIRASAGGMEPGGFVLVGNQVPRGRERGDYHSRPSDAPAQTITSQSRTWTLRSNYGTGGDPANRGERRADQPAPTITSKADRNKWEGKRRMVAAEAAALQSYPDGFPFAGPATKQFLQIGNAVPPLMGGAIIDELLAPAALRAVPEVVERAA
ncbi:DNA (cytosine-5)-methyltransferase 1 [Microbacterium testaceum]|uniref:DNA cytosine methyltransferase n=1 Tax=Microbacterium TaxID=33882 RepID=UPI00278A178D|nr:MULTISPECIES: DNA cytosine methyltransferase [Microbacterium]MDQ1111193.1 DNA (cytosine-5)-methyltransferase 1 [Microbacterium testaceum]MDR6098267.1 DNA (cytosine-5)-methyltransferase 1 [Microbacterium sp. SORGH_AS_0454]